MKRILWLDPSVASANLGDEIIAEAVARELRSLFPDGHISRGFTQEPIGDSIRSLHGRSDHTFVGGTNLLSSEMDSYAQWKIGKARKAHLSGVVLFGVGWWQYQGRPNRYTAGLLAKTLHRGFAHSVRDGYTARQLASIGIDNVINTACPTMWGLDREHCKGIPRKIAEYAVLTITDYYRSPAEDRELIATLRRNYKGVFLWPQGMGDLEYLRDISGTGADIRILPPSLDAFRGLLEDRSISLDYIGTRLHAGIYALKHSRRSLILAVDNRAVEMGGDFKLPILKRDDIGRLDAMLRADIEADVSLPVEDIKRWRSQFSDSDRV